VLNHVATDSAADVARQVEEAFRDVPYPGDDHLTDGSSMEALDVADFLRGRDWRDLRLDELVTNHASLFFMTPEAVRFYLPAYLTATLLHYNDADQIPGSVMFLLKTPAASDADAYGRYRARFGNVSPAQRQAIRAFLTWIRDEHAEDFPAEGGVDEPSTLLRSWAG